MITEFKIFESRNKKSWCTGKADQPYKSPSSRRKEAIDKSNKYKQFVPGAYIVFRFSNEEMIQNLRKNMSINKMTFDDSVILARIISVNESPYDEIYKTEVYLELQPIKYRIFNFITITEIDKIKEFNMSFMSNIQISTSLLKAEEKYNQLIEDMEIKYNAEKYNL